MAAPRTAVRAAALLRVRSCKDCLRDIAAEEYLVTVCGVVRSQHVSAHPHPHTHPLCRYNTEHDAPYWRGPIWININYLTLRALKHYSTTPGLHQAAASSTYQQLRANLLGNLVRQYSSTGYLWEQYSDEDGKPKGCHPFTGWTALLTLIASEAY